MQYVKVPDERLTFLKNEVQTRLEDDTGCSITIDNNALNVEVSHNDSVEELDATRVVKAVSHGFDYYPSIKLAQNPINQLEVISIKDHTRNEKEFNRQKGRVIGENGRTRELIQELTDTHIRIYRDTVSIIGETEDVMQARRAVMGIISGRPHATVYRDLEEYNKAKNQMFVETAQQF